ncbi:glycine--tRNA ligase subunit beta [Sphingomonas sp.]|uniref:glycine--tRNA ligase subunit beta n=1 Tax=Sphingomonas sp. TaxID=28214 RepID=UPI00289A2A46|nr:glycine--tRNA ligase subunit beta [Sphingomonas sp.]
MTDFLLELRSEEIPARMQAKARSDLQWAFETELRVEGALFQGRVRTYATPRRLTLIAEDLADQTESDTKEFKGPKVGAPEAAIEGFLKKVGVTREELSEEPDAKGVLTYYARTITPGRPTTEVLATIIPRIIRAFPWPKSMRWGAESASTESMRWVRPLHAIVALFGGEVVPFEIAGITSGNTTRGHRFHAPAEITLTGADTYVEQLRAAKVLVDQDERAAIIRERASALAAEAGLELVEDEGLVAENAGLTEWPVPLLGRFDEAYLDVPPEVIQLTARVNQKYFVCRSGDGKLANAFVCTANIEATDGGAKIVEGNGKVLAARLSDARFFYETDKKTKLDDLSEKLSKIVFHARLGTLGGKLARIQWIGEKLVRQGILNGLCHKDRDQEPLSVDELAALVDRAALLSKLDLVTGMVGEFPELQGLMGGYYALHQGENRLVADAIRDHYKPVGQNDDVPVAPVTVAVSMADKLDTILAFFSIGERPSGSKDPFALRRAALGILRIITVNDLRFRLKEILGGVQVPGLPVGDVDGVLAFFIERLKVQQREAGVRHDLIDAVFALGGEDDLVRLLARVRALQAFVTTDDGANLLAGYKRAANILKKEGVEGEQSWAAPTYTLEPAEADLIAALDAAEPKAAQAVKAEDFEAAMAALASLRAPIDRFFDDVTVNDADPAKRTARLALLARVRAAVHTVADFSRIEG